MENTLKELQEHQFDALQKGIAYDLNIFINEDRIPFYTVKMFYSATGDIMDNRSFQTTISTDDKFTNFKIGRIKKFINDIEEEK